MNHTNYIHCKIVKDAQKCQCGQLLSNQCKKFKLYSFKNLLIIMFHSSSMFFVSNHVLTIKVFTTITSLMCMYEARGNLSQCAPCICPNVPPHDILRKIRFIINSKCPSTWLTSILSFSLMVNQTLKKKKKHWHKHFSNKSNSKAR